MRPNFSEHQANERTFLAWLRTSVAIIAFGFVLERFGLFLKYLAPASANRTNSGTGLVGVGLIWLGTVMIAVSLWRFLVEERHIDRPLVTGAPNWPMIALAILLVMVGVYLAVSAVS